MNFPKSREEFPLLDSGLAALVTDLHERNLDKDVSVVVWGEFGRTPKINSNNSRDHWPQLNAALLAGGGMRTGQVIGRSNKYGEHAVERPVKFQEIFATLYKSAGLDIGQVRIFDQPACRNTWLTKATSRCTNWCEPVSCFAPADQWRGWASSFAVRRIPSAECLPASLANCALKRMGADVPPSVRRR